MKHLRSLSQQDKLTLPVDKQQVRNDNLPQHNGLARRQPIEVLGVSLPEVVSLDVHHLKHEQPKKSDTGQIH